MEHARKGDQQCPALNPAMYPQAPEVRVRKGIQVWWQQCSRPSFSGNAVSGISLGVSRVPSQLSPSWQRLPELQPSWSRDSTELFPEPGGGVHSPEQAVALPTCPGGLVPWLQGRTGSCSRTAFLSLYSSSRTAQAHLLDATLTGPGHRDPSERS